MEDDNDINWMFETPDGMVDDRQHNAEMEFVQAEMHPEALHIMRGYAVNEFYNWEQHARQEALIPADWPPVKIFKREDEVVEAEDWPTWVLLAALARSGSSLTMLPRSYDEIAHYVWETSSGVVMTWLGGSKHSASLTRGELKRETQRRLRACRNNTLLVDSGGLTAQFTNIVEAVRSVTQADQSDGFMDRLMAAMPNAEPGQMTGVMNLSQHIHANLMVLQTPGFYRRRVVALVQRETHEVPYGVTDAAALELGKDMLFLHVLHHTDEFFCCLYQRSVKEHVEGLYGENSCLLLLDEASPAFAPLGMHHEWFTSSDPSKWILSPMARDMRGKYER